MAFDAYDRSLDLLKALAPLLEDLTARDRDLEDELRRAACSVVRNVAEGSRRRGKDRLHCFRLASGSAAEVASCLDIAAALGYADEARMATAIALCDRVKALTWRLAA